MFSVIIPCREIDEYEKECIEHCKQLDYGTYETIVLPDACASGDFEGVRVVPTGVITPGAKRNIGVDRSNGDVCAFIDSDAYPQPDWLGNAVKYFDDPAVGAIGGPNLTPESDGIRQKASGYVTSSFMVGGLSTRYRHGALREVDDTPSCNFLVRRSVIKKTGGWNERYWPGEDTLMCLEIRKLGYKILEADDVVVYHRRRPLFVEHLTQVSRFGLHRGFFAKKFGGNSMHLTYFAPSIWLVVLIVLAALSLAFGVATYLLEVTLVIYIIASLLATLLETRSMRTVPMVWMGIWLTHLTYGTFFIAGLLKRELQR